jgi:hypothetical protein
MSLRITHKWLTISAGFLFTMTAYAHKISAPETARHMFQAAETFLESLSPEQRNSASFSFKDDERYDWHYTPRKRSGLALKDMSADQQALSLKFLKVGLSQSGYWKSTTIMKLEAVLREIETLNWLGRDPEKYYFSFFGLPSLTGTWGWRVEGHHLSLNFTIVQGQLFATAPRFLGANPAKVAAGELSGVRTLAGEEDLARKLLTALDPEQRLIISTRYGAISTVISAETC